MSSFSPQRLLQAVTALPVCERYVVAFSGGMDSHVLLHALVAASESLSRSIYAVHVNHGLSANAAAWADHCRSVCQQLGIPLQVIDVDAQPQPGQSPEAAARDARYQALAEIITARDGLLTAHHIDDQAETLLLQLLRGCGPQGLAAMPKIANFSAATLLRPLLEFSRNELRDYAEQHQLSWIEDPSNSDTGLRRNYLRHEVMPRLADQWPGLTKTLSRSASLCGDAAALTHEMASEDFQRVRGQHSNTLIASELKKLSTVRQCNLLRYWIQQMGFPQPHRVHVEQVLQQVFSAGQDRLPLIQWPGCEIRRYQDNIYVLSPSVGFQHQQVIAWDLKAPLELPFNNGVLSMQPVATGGVDEKYLTGQKITVRYRQGGEVCRPYLRNVQRPLKKCLQELSIAPWLRDRVPLLYIDEQLAAVGDYFVCQPFVAANSPGRTVLWQPL